MNLAVVVRAIRTRKRLISLSSAAGLLLAILLSFLVPASYSASVLMYVAAQGGLSSEAAYQGAQLSEERVKTYNELVTSPPVLVRVSEGTPGVSVADLESSITVTNEIDSVVLNVVVDTPDAALSLAIANQIANVFPRYVAEIEQPTDRTASPPLAVSAVGQAELTSTNTPSIPAYGVAGLLGALVLALGVSIGLELTDKTFRTTEELREQTGEVVLGETYGDEEVGTRVSLEAYRHIRTSLRFVDVDRPPQAIVITSSNFSEGKTSAACSIATSMAEAGFGVLVIDADLRRPGVANHLGLGGSSGLTSVLAGQASLKDVIQRSANGGFDVLPAGLMATNPSEMLGSRQMRSLLSEARRRYEYIFIDSAPVRPVSDTAALAPSSDGVLFVVRSQATPKGHLEEAVGSIRNTGSAVLGMILTFSSPRNRLGRYYDYYSIKSEESGSQGATIEWNRT